MEGVITLIEQDAPVVLDTAVLETEVVETTPAQDNPPADEVVDTPPLTDPLPQEEDEYDFNFTTAIEAPQGKKKISASSLKELDEDMWDDDNDLEVDETTAAIVEKLTERAKKYKETSNQYKTIAEANEVIKKDPQLRAMQNFADLPDKDLVLQARVNKLIKAGRDKETALDEATEYVNRYDEGEIGEQAKDLRIDVGVLFQERSKYLHGEIEKTAKALTLSDKVNPELVTNATTYLDKIGSFLGLKIGSKNESDKTAFLKPVKNAIKSGDVLKTLQNDPKKLAEVALFLQYKDKFSEAISSRKTPKTKVFEELSDAPASNGAAQVQRNAPSTGSVLKNPKAFK